MVSGREPLFRRNPANPILTAADLPYPANAVFNPGAARVDEEALLLVRVEDMRGISQLQVARSADGVSGWRFDDRPLLRSEPDHTPEEVWGCEDPRLTRLPDEGTWAIAYTAFSSLGPLVALATTRDFRTVERIGPVMTPEDKDAALFPRRFGGRWAMIHRPSPIRGGAHMWISFSPDLRHWADHQLLLEARDGAWWDAGKIGVGPPPIETPDGWLILYHGAHMTARGPVYRVGLALLDLEDPTVVPRRSDDWVFGPQAVYERSGDVPQIVFPCGAILDAAADRLDLYYGGADTVVCLASATFSDVMDYVRSCPRPQRRRVSDRGGQSRPPASSATPAAARFRRPLREQGSRGRIGRRGSSGAWLGQTCRSAYAGVARADVPSSCPVGSSARTATNGAAMDSAMAASRPRDGAVQSAAFLAT